MLRRTFFKSLGSNLVLSLFPRWSRAQMAVASKGVSLNEIALVVLPESLGPKRTADAVDAFERWIRGYQAGADAGYGYGHTKPTVTGPNPSAHYEAQLEQLNAAAMAKGSSFAGLSKQDKRELIQGALTSAGVAAIPAKPNGKYVAADLMSFFYSSSGGVDFCYGVAIRESDCRGLSGSDQRPAAII